MESPTTQPNELNSNNSSQDSLLNYLNDLTFLEAPLVGLCPKPLNTMTEDELRTFVQKQRSLRESRQTFKAAVVAAEERGTTVQKPKENIFADFEE